MPITTLWGLLFTFWTTLALGAVALNPGHPERYTVAKGDTLWEIAGRFLQQPWRWPEVWRANPQIKNPNLIYPGDLITLSHRDGRPELSLQRGHPTVVLSPEVRATPLPKPIPTVPIDAVRPFLIRPLVVDEQDLKTAAYVVGNADGRLMAGMGDHVYVRGLQDPGPAHFTVFRPGPAIKDIDGRRVLGYEAIYVADLELIKPGEVAVLTARRTASEIQGGDRVLPLQEEVDQSFFPRAPEQPVEGRIVAVPSGHLHIGRYDVVTVSLGRENGITVGDVLAVNQAGGVAKDPVTGKDVRLPDERAGLLMLFRVFDRLSYGVVMQAQRDIRPQDVVTNPD